MPKHISSLFNAHESHSHVSDYTDVLRFPFSSDKLEKLLVPLMLSWKIQA